MKEISYKELRNLPFGTKVRVVPTPSGRFKSYDGMVCNGLLLYEYGDTSDLKLLEMYEDSKLKNPNNHITKYYILEEENPYEKIWNDLKKDINDTIHYLKYKDKYWPKEDKDRFIVTYENTLETMNRLEKENRINVDFFVKK